ncbi:hypothetical protein NM208_g9665 [Fusarium decemcellulare]|uniref:Uncharacterized protein n=1 Tax=Fusarium decemcellulare TaxID=57161 RepID=A0ACC1S0P7_9HYPO|nr:hypothetical protein NM208_g9665 [Fusarium decemcellulare]
MKAQGLALVLAELSTALALPSKAPASEPRMALREVTNADGHTIQLAVRDSLVENAGVSKRQITFPSTSFDGNYCGDSSFSATNDDKANGGNIDDCNNLVSGLRGIKEHWELNNGFGGAAASWIQLAAIGTCHFYINRNGFPDATTDGIVLIGTSDVADLVQTATERFTQWGEITFPGGSQQIGWVNPSSGNMECDYHQDVPWRIQRNNP